MVELADISKEIALEIKLTLEIYFEFNYFFLNMARMVNIKRIKNIYSCK
jgi:hypothetical protein